MKAEHHFIWHLSLKECFCIFFKSICYKSCTTMRNFSTFPVQSLLALWSSVNTLQSSPNPPTPVLVRNYYSYTWKATNPLFALFSAMHLSKYSFILLCFLHREHLWEMFLHSTITKIVLPACIDGSAIVMASVVIVVLIPDTRLCSWQWVSL